jgi:hypothetical protein
MIMIFALSSCVYRSGPSYDYGYGPGYGYGYRHRVPPPRRVVVVPAPPPRAVYRERPRYHNNGRSNRNYNRQNYRQYGNNGRSGHR